MELGRFMVVARAGEQQSSVGVSSAPLHEFILYFLRLGTYGFGGPIALAGYMQRDLVDRHRWISHQDYLEGLAFSQLCPGPLAAQLAMYLGWVRAGRLGATLVGLAFILPSFVMVLALAALYVHYEGRLPWLQGAFYGMGAAVIGILAISAYKLSRKMIGRDWLGWFLFLVGLTVTVWTESEMVGVFILGGLVAVLLRTPPRFTTPPRTLILPPWAEWLLGGLHGPASAGDLWQILWYFVEAGAFVFGSGLAIVPFLHGGIVDRFGWLNEQQFLDAVAVAMITPGPVVITVGFVGYMVAGPCGGTIAAMAVFLPCYLLVIVFAPYYRFFARNERIKAFVQGITATVIGAIAGAAIIISRRTLIGRGSLVEVPAALIALAALAVLLSGKRVPEPVLILAAGAIGLVLKQWATVG
jgi:chromate transporter